MEANAVKGFEIAGLLVVDKPLGWSSMEVVRRVRLATGVARCGHAGTLDPLATGVVLCCIGRLATRCVPLLMGLPKIYQAQVDLSAFSDTDDREGKLQSVEVAEPPKPDELLAALSRFVGTIAQVPPSYSAVHVQGQRAYKLARKGQAVELAARRVEIHGIELLDYGWPLAGLRVHCGKGVYIRSLARDLGLALGTGGHLAGLRRLAIGPYDLSKAVTGPRLAQPMTAGDLLPLPSLDAQSGSN